MNLFFITSDQYPNGGASSNRHMAYAKGLVTLDNKVTFILLSDQQKPDNGFVEDGINFVSVSSVGKKINDSIAKKLYSTFRSVVNARKQISNFHSKEKIDAVVLLDTYIWILYPFLKFCRNKNIKVFHERTEYPLVVEIKGIIGKVHNMMYSSFVLPKFDGIFVISLALQKYFLDITKNKVPVEILNMVVDPSRFQAYTSSDLSDRKYIVYSGSMDLEKDGVDILIRSFGMAIHELGLDKDIDLMLIGDTSNEFLKAKLDRIIEEARCSERVIFTGLITRQRIPEFLNNAHALALARPDNKQAEGGFPTKLGEYLSTGKPVIITDVGEIGLFLKDGENAFIAHAGNVASFSEKIVQVFKQYPDALRVGEKGRELVFNEFNYVHQANKLVSFIKGIVHKE